MPPYHSFSLLTTRGNHYLEMACFYNFVIHPCLHPYTVYVIVSLANCKKKKMGIWRLKYKIYQPTVMYGPYLDTVVCVFFFNVTF